MDVPPSQSCNTSIGVGCRGGLRGRIRCAPPHSLQAGSAPTASTQIDPWPIFDELRAKQETEVTYGIDAGLPSVHTLALEVGPEGRIWVATGGGLVTFDGLSFRPPDQRLRRDPGADGDAGQRSPEGSGGGYVICLLRDSRNRMWASTLTGEVRRYGSDEYQDLPVTGILGRTSSLVEAGDGAIWAGGRGLVRITDEAIEQMLDVDPQSSPYVTGLATMGKARDVQAGADPPGGPLAVWISTSEGLHRWTPAGGLEQLDTEAALGVFFDASDRLWCIRRGSIEVNGVPFARSVAPHSRDLRKAIWIDQDRTLVVLDGETLIVDFEDGDPLVESFGDPRSIDTALRGPNDTLWLGLGSRGLRSLSLKGFTDIPVPAPGQTLFVAKPAGPRGVAFASPFQSVFWVAEPTEVNPSGTPVETFDFDDASLGAPIDGYCDLEVDLEGNGWMSTGAGVLYRSDGSIQRAGSGPKTVLREGQIVRMPSGNTWAWDQLRLVEFRNGAATGRIVPLDDSFVSQMIRDGEDLLLFQEQKIIRCSTSELKCETILELPGSMFGGVFLAANGDLWAPTDGNGLYRRRATGEVDRWTVEQGLPSDSLGWTGTVPGPTESTRLWVNSNAGVASITLESLDRTADTGEGLLEFDFLHSGETLGSDGVALESGILVLPTVHGPISVNTNDPPPERGAPALRVGDIWADGLKFSAGDHLRGHTDLAFEFSAAQFPFRRTSFIEFRLDGHDSDWNRAGQDRLARYTGLAPGEYRFELRARAAGQNYGATVRGPRLEILHHWYQRWTVRLAILAAIVCLSLVGFRLRTARLRRHAADLEAEVQRRRKAEEFLLELRNKESLYRRHLARAEEAERSRIARELDDDLSQRLAAVSLNLHATTESLQEQINPKGQAALRSSQDGIARIAGDVQALSRQLHPSILDDLGLSAALRSECTRRQRLTEARIELDDDGQCVDVRDEIGLALYRVAQEALRNAVTHSEARHVYVTLERVDSEVKLGISDDGCGLDELELVESGLGILSMRERMNLVGGSLAVESAPGSGTRIVATAALKGSEPDPSRAPSHRTDRRQNV